jgi:predicted AlkP superfamily phosphohydrolase/phosphomutase
MRRFALAALGSILAFGCGKTKEHAASRASEAPPARAAVESSDAPARTPRPAAAGGRVIWIGLDGLDPDLLARLAASGSMPNWKQLASEGYVAPLESELPLLSPILWTTEATGVAPDVHRVLDFQEVDPASGRKVPISGASRAVPAVWNLASSAGRKVGVVGWWATHPAEEVNGYFVSDHATPILFEGLSLEGVAYPGSVAAGVAAIVARDGRVGAEDLLPFLRMPEARIREELEKGGGMENPVVALSRILAATRVTQRLARDLYDREAPDLAAVYFEGTDEAGHVFAPFTPPRPPCPNLSDADLERYGRVVETYYGVVDRLLGQWMRRAREDRAVLLVTSDHGFKWGDDRPCGFSSGNWSTAAFWHRREGVFALWGAGVVAARSAPVVSLRDVAPTVLAVLGVPASPRMTGVAVTAAFRGLTVLPRARSLDEPPVRRVAAAAPSAEASSEYAKKLLALGYLSPGQTEAVAPPGGDRPGMTEGAWNNLGVSLRETKKDLVGARAAFEKSLALRPDYYSPMFNLAVLSRMQGKTREAEDWFFRSVAAAGGEPSGPVTAWAREYARDGREKAAASLLERAARQYPRDEAIARERALSLHRTKDCAGAVAALAPFEAATADPETLNDLALFETCLGDRDAVERLLARSLALKPDQPQVARLLEVVRRAAKPQP